MLGEAEFVRRGGGKGGGIQQLGASRGRAAVPLDDGHRRVDLPQCIPGQAGREQDRALVDEQRGREDPQLVKQALCIVEVGERGGEIAAGVHRYRAFLAREGILRLVSAFDPQCLDPGIVPVGPLDITQGEVRCCSPVHGPRFPGQIVRAGQHVDGGLDVPQSFGMAAQDPQGTAPAEQHFPCWDAPAALHHRVKDRQAAPRLPGQNPGGTQAGLDVGFSIQVSGPAREPEGILKLPDRFTHIAEVPEDQADGIVRHRGLRRRGLLSQHLTSDRKGLPWPR